MEKSRIRTEILSRRNQLTKEQISLGGTILLEKIIKEEAWKQNDVVYLYSSFGSEVSTNALFMECLKTNKRVAFPKVMKKGVMEFYEVKGTHDLITGFQGILEPKGEKKPIREAGLVLVPGVAFDEENHRIGYGGGYYDRYFSTYSFVPFSKFGLAYSFQIVPRIETESFDEPVDKVITIFLSS